MDLRGLFSTKLFTVKIFPHRLFSGRRSYEDVFYLDSWKEAQKFRDHGRVPAPTSFSAIIPGYYPSGLLFRDEAADDRVVVLTGHESADGQTTLHYSSFAHTIICPSCSIDISKENTPVLQELFQGVKLVARDSKVEASIGIGEYPSSRVDDKQKMLLEELLQTKSLELKKTGRFYSRFGDARGVSIISPEFEYEGERFVKAYYANGDACWFKVSPVEFIVRNYDDLPTWLNPKGRGRAKSLELKAQYGVISGFAYSEKSQAGRTKWEDSFIRLFLNNGFISDNRLDSCFGFMNEAFNLGRTEVNEITLPEVVTVLAEGCLENCDFEVVRLPKSLTELKPRAFKGSGLKYLVRDGDSFYVSKDAPVDANQENCISLEFLELLFAGKTSCIEVFDYENFTEPNKIAQVLKSTKIRCSAEFVEHISLAIERGRIDGLNFAFFAQNLKEHYDKLIDVDDVEYGRANAFLKFAYVIGCFDNSALLDKNKRPTDTIVAQKACNLLKTLIEKEILTVEEIVSIGNKIDGFSRVNQEFLSFATKRGKDGRYELLEDLIQEMRSRRYGAHFMAKIVSKFNSVVGFRRGFDKNGKPVRFSWRDTINRFYSTTTYRNITQDNIDIAMLFSSMGIEEQKLKMATRLREASIRSGISHNITTKPVKEMTILDEIKLIEESTKGALLEGKEQIDKLMKKSFTYEMLDKYDPANFIIGIYASCCASVCSESYGEDLVRATALYDNVQNLVVRDSAGNIVAKGTLYVDRERGYAVINEFEVNEQYDVHSEFNCGRKISNTRKKIFNAFMRGIKAFVEEYDRENPTAPIMQVNVGIGFNDLRRFCEECEEERNLKAVPVEMSFVDARHHQRVLYRRGIPMRMQIIDDAAAEDI